MVLNDKETIEFLQKDTPIILKCKFTISYCEHDKSGITSYLKCSHPNVKQEDKTNCCKSDIKCNYFENIFEDLKK